MIDRFFPDKIKEDTDGNFKGGSIRSIIAHLDYIQSLGMTGIMLTPFYKTAAYHGYHIIDYDSVDPHFGTKEDLEELIAKVHQRGMTIVADFVANHCHKDCQLYANGKHKDWFQYHKDGTVKGFGNIPYLPVFNTDNEEVRRYLTDKGLRLCEYGFDAIRLDHAIGPSYDFWLYFRNTIKKRFPKNRLIGEVWGGKGFKPRDSLRFFFDRLRYGAQEAEQLEYVGILDGVLDFRYQELLCDTVRKGVHILNNKRLTKRVERHFCRYPPEFQLWLFLDNHDLNRFLFECHGEPHKKNELLKEGIEFSEQWTSPYLMFYGTEQNFANRKSIFDGTPYADERVRMCLTTEKKNINNKTTLKQ